ncbi:MAG: hypothetical protein ACQKBU_09095, partial [Verrucomicrobiales bacterium]
MSTPASVNIARLVYLLICEMAGLILALSTRGSTSFEIPMWLGLVIGLVVAGFFILVERLMKDFTLRGFSTATFGLLVGLFCAFLLTRIGLADVLVAVSNRGFESNGASQFLEPDSADAISLGASSMIYASFGFLGAVLALRSTRDDFAFIIPYVRFRQDGTSGRPVVLDGEAIMDGRVPGVVRAGFLGGRLIVPRFVLDELQDKAGSETQADRVRASRSLTLLEEMQDSKGLAVSIEDVAPSNESREARL